MDPDRPYGAGPARTAAVGEPRPVRPDAPARTGPRGATRRTAAPAADRWGRPARPYDYHRVDGPHTDDEEGEDISMTEDARDERRPAGGLEASVMAALWAADGPLTPGQVQAGLGADLARTTVTTILSRLHDKGVVERQRRGRGFVYFPVQEVQDAHGLTARRMHTELDRDSDRETVLARFVAQLNPDDERILRDLLESDG